MKLRKLAHGLVLALSAALFMSTPASAHERWFVKEGTHPADGLPFDWSFIPFLAGAVVLVGLAITAGSRPMPPRLATFSERLQRSLPAGSEWRFVAALIGATLIANAISGVYLASDLVLPAGWPAEVGRYAQIFVGLLLFSQVAFAFAGALVLVVAVPLAVAFLPAASLIDYAVEYLAVGLMLVFVGLSACPDRLGRRLFKVNPERFASLPLPTIRIGLGLSLIVLALHNKLLNPDIALTFLDEYQFNFVAALGFSGFTNMQFVFAAGVAEVLLGTLLLAGILTRLAAVALLGFFGLTLAMLGIRELVGHLPLIGVALLLVYRGPGGATLPSWLRETGRRRQGLVSSGRRAPGDLADGG